MKSQAEAAAPAPVELVIAQLTVLQMMLLSVMLQGMHYPMLRLITQQITPVSHLVMTLAAVTAAAKAAVRTVVAVVVFTL